MAKFIISGNKQIIHCRSQHWRGSIRGRRRRGRMCELGRGRVAKLRVPFSATRLKFK